MNVLENLALNMIINKEVECLMLQKSQTEHQKVMELKDQINSQIRRAEAQDDSHMVQIVRKRTLTRMNTLKSEHETCKEDDTNSKCSEMINKYVLDYSSSKNSSQIKTRAPLDKASVIKDSPFC